jgi:flavodoxin short chain
MAKAIEQGAKAKGVDVAVLTVDKAPADAAGQYEKIAFGCPSMGAEVLEESEFEPFFTDIEKKLAGKKVALFGSYGWGDGEWMREWQKRTEAAGATVFEEGFIQQEAPDEELCKKFGERFADF